MIIEFVAWAFPFVIFRGDQSAGLIIDIERALRAVGVLANF